MIDILQVFIYADNLPPSVLDFISPSLDALALKLSARSTSPLDVSRVSKLASPYFTRISTIRELLYCEVACNDTKIDISTQLQNQLGFSNYPPICQASSNPPRCRRLIFLRHSTSLSQKIQLRLLQIPSSVQFFTVPRS